jgi:DNA-binding CsgD family transcriptional regulator
MHAYCYSDPNTPSNKTQPRGQEIRWPVDLTTQAGKNLTCDNFKKVGRSRSVSVAISRQDDDNKGPSKVFLGNADNTSNNATPAAALPDLLRLSPRQHDVLFGAANGKSAWETAQVLCLTEATVKSYIANACARLSADNKTHAVAIVISRGLFSI